MCLCSQIRASRTSGAVVAEATLQQLQEFLEITFTFLSENQELGRKLPFNLRRNNVGQMQNVKQRISKIFKYNPFEHSTQVVLLCNYTKWEDNPSEFLNHLQNPSNIKTLDPQQFLVSLCLQAAESDAHSAILRRVYCYVLAGLRDKETHTCSAETIAKSIYRDLYSGNGNIEELVKSVKKLIEAGSRYRNIAKRSGLGSLFVLGTEIATAVWEQWLPLKGQLFEESVAHLKEKGVVVSGKLYESLALRVVAILEEKLPKAPTVVWVGAEKRKSHKDATQSRNPCPVTTTSKASKRQRCDLNNERRQITSVEGSFVDSCLAHIGERPASGVSMQALATVAEQYLHGLHESEAQGCEARIGTQTSCANENPQPLDRNSGERLSVHRGDDGGDKGSADIDRHLFSKDSGKATSGGFQTLHTANLCAEIQEGNLEALSANGDPTCLHRHSYDSTMVENERRTSEGTHIELGQFDQATDIIQNDFINSISDSPPEITHQEQATHCASISLPVVLVPTPNDSTSFNFFPACSDSTSKQGPENTVFSLMENVTNNTEALNAGKDPNTTNPFYSTLNTHDPYGQTIFDYNSAIDVRNLNFDYNNAVDVRSLSFDYNDAIDVRSLNFDYNNAIDIRGFAVDPNNWQPYDILQPDSQSGHLAMISPTRRVESNLD